MGEHVHHKIFGRLQRAKYVATSSFIVHRVTGSLIMFFMLCRKMGFTINTKQVLAVTYQPMGTMLWWCLAMPKESYLFRHSQDCGTLRSKRVSFSTLVMHMPAVSMYCDLFIPLYWPSLLPLEHRLFQVYILFTACMAREGIQSLFGAQDSLHYHLILDVCTTYCRQREASASQALQRWGDETYCSGPKQCVCYIAKRHSIVKAMIL